MTWMCLSVWFIPMEITMGVGVLKIVVIFTTMIMYNLEGFFEPGNN